MPAEDEAMRILLAGATGVIGRHLLPLLRDAGHTVVGTTRSSDKAGALMEAGAEPLVLDVFNAAATMRAFAAVRPTVLIHQLTDLPQTPDPEQMAAAYGRNARLRIEGTRNLMQAAVAAGLRRVVAQSIAFAYAPGPLPQQESDPLDLAAEGARRTTVEGVAALETCVTGTPGIEGIVLRYGRLYGPGTWHQEPRGPAPLHVDAAAHAALLAVDRGEPGIYNIAEDDGAVATDKAQRALGFHPDFRIAPSVGAPD